MYLGKRGHQRLQSTSVNLRGKEMHQRTGILKGVGVAYYWVRFWPLRLETAGGSLYSGSEISPHHERLRLFDE